jgi:hypothetical protein
VIEIVVPLGGFGRRLDAMHEHLRGIRHAQGRGRCKGERDIMRWLFARREDAEAFAKEFDGTIIEQVGVSIDERGPWRPPKCKSVRQKGSKTPGIPARD